MMRSAISILIEGQEHGQRLEAHGEKLRVIPADRCTAEFAETLRVHKSALLALLKLPFVLVHSEPLGAWLFLCDDDQTRQALIKAGAQKEDVIYTRAELRILLAHNRARPFVPAELLALHNAKQLFNAKITRCDL
jgi:hypothetical protein